jgi:4-hydroxybenzoate polyprenyltransferase
MASPLIDSSEIEDNSLVKKGIFGAIFTSLRPRQWTKNLVVFAGLLFSLDFKHVINEFETSVFAFIIFCMLSSATYLINDVCDIKVDLEHPTKCHRPIASGQVSPSIAIVLAVSLFIFCCTAAYLIRPLFAFACISYTILTVSYSIWLKHVVILDLLILATGFVLRAAAGAWAIHVPISDWLLLCTLLFALFLGVGKRRAELIAVLAGRKQGRVVMSEYTASMLDQMGTVVASALVMSYALYSIQSQTAQHHHYLVVTFPFVLYGILRYSYLIHKRQDGEAPDELLLKDKSLLTTVLAWGIVTGIIMTHKL